MSDQIAEIVAELLRDGVLIIVGYEDGEPLYQVTPGGDDVLATRIRQAEGTP